MKISKKILSILLSVVMVLGVCAAGFTAGAYDAYLAVGGLEINLESDGSYYDGKVKYEAEIHTLTFDDFELRYEHCCINAMHLGFDLTIKGRAEFTDPSSEGISVSFHDSNLIIDCESFSVERIDCGLAICVDGNLTVNGGSLRAECSSAPDPSIGVDGNLTVNGGSVYAKNKSSGNALGIGGELVLPDGSGEAIVLGNAGASEVLISALRGKGTAEEPYEISTYGGLKEYSSIVNGTNVAIAQNTSAHAKLMKDIDASASASANDWTPIGNGSGSGDSQIRYAGIFDGKDSDGIMHTITGLTYNKSDADYAGLFGRVGSGGSVQNVGIEDGSITGRNYVGGVVGINDGTVTNCYNTGAVSGSSYVGGVVGINHGTVTNCYNTGDVTSAGSFSYAGGVVGINYGTVINCYNTGAVFGETRVGGVAGFIANDAEVANCYNTGTVSGSSYVGGIAGFNSDEGIITNCYYDKDRCAGVSALGRGSGTNVKDLTTAEMTGSSALENMVFTYEGGEENPWLVKENEETNSVSVKYYPHLKGFAYDSDPTAENWPPKITLYPLWVGGEQVTSANMGDLTVIEGVSVAEGGYAKFEVVDGKNILTLKNATITGTQTYDYYGIEEYTSNILVEDTEFALIINLEGENTLGDAADHGIWMLSGSDTSDLTLTGGGKLSVTANRYCIHKNWNLLIDGADISATATGNENGDGSGIVAWDVEIENSSVYAEGTGNGYGIYCLDALSITDSSVEAKSTGTYGAGIFFDIIYDWTVSGDSIVIAEGGSEYGALFRFDEIKLNDGNEIIEPVKYKIQKDSYDLNAIYAIDDEGTETLAQKVVIAQPQTISVTANPSNGGTVTGGGKTYKGAKAKVTATPKEHYSFINWAEDGEAVSTDAEYEFDVESSRNLVANFAADTHTVKVSANNADGGSASGGGTYDYGSSATVTATPNDHYHFVSWTENGTVVSTSADYTFTVESSRNLVANFVIDTYTITFENDDGTPLQSGSVAYGEIPVYNGKTPAKADDDEFTYTFAGWSPEITSVTGEATYTATYDKTPVDYKLTWVIDSENFKNETIPFGSNVAAPEVDEKAGYTFAWVDEIPATMPAENVTINGKYTAITYTATFVDENGKTVDEVTFTVDDEKLDEPEVPAKANYTGEWEEYTIEAKDITIKPVYTPVKEEEPKDENPVISVKGDDELTLKYRQNATFTADAKDIPGGGKVVWYLNGEKAGEGNTFTVEKPEKDYTVQAKILDKDGNEAAQSETVKVKVKNGFFDKIRAFFSDLFSKLFFGFLDGACG